MKTKKRLAASFTRRLKRILDDEVEEPSKESVLAQTQDEILRYIRVTRKLGHECETSWFTEFSTSGLTAEDLSELVKALERIEGAKVLRNCGSPDHPYFWTSIGLAFLTAERKLK